MGSYRRSVLKIALWLLPCFFIWDLVLGPLMSVVGVKVNAVWLEHVYSQHNLWFHYDVKSELFEQRSNLFRASFPYADQSYIPNLAVGQTRQKISNFNLLSLGLPTFLLLILSFLPTSCLNRHRLRLIFCYCLFLILLAIVLYGITMWLSYVNLLLPTNMDLRIKTPQGLVIFVVPPEMWLVELFELIKKALLFFSVLVVPSIACRKILYPAT